MENLCFIAYVNRVGPEFCQFLNKPIDMCGTSIICAPDGEILAQGSADKADLLSAVLDPREEKLAEYRKHNPQWLDRRPELYASLSGKAAQTQTHGTRKHPEAKFSLLGGQASETALLLLAAAAGLVASVALWKWRKL
jgi:hypothetical protein